MSRKEIYIFEIRDEDGDAEPYYSVTYNFDCEYDPDEDIERLVDAEAFAVEVQEHHTDAVIVNEV